MFSYYVTFLLKGIFPLKDFLMNSGFSLLIAGDSFLKVLFCKFSDFVGLDFPKAAMNGFGFYSTYIF